MHISIVGHGRREFGTHNGRIMELLLTTYSYLLVSAHRRDGRQTHLNLVASCPPAAGLIGRNLVSDFQWRYCRRAGSDRRVGGQQLERALHGEMQMTGLENRKILVEASKSVLLDLVDATCRWN